MSTILLVEGNQNHMNSASELLQNHGHSIIDANNAGDGIRLAKEEQPDIILLGTQLPGMDCVMTARLLKANPITRNIKIIAIAADAVDHRQKMLFAGADEYLNRPFAINELLNLIKDMIKTNEQITIPHEPIHESNNNVPEPIHSGIHEPLHASINIDSRPSFSG